MNVKQTINGVVYDCCWPDSWYLADCICKEYHDDYVLKSKQGGFFAQIFMHPKREVKSYYGSDSISVENKNATPRCLGWLLWNPDTDIITLRKTSVDSELHEHHLSDSLAISYDIFKHLRDGDIIQIHTDFTDKDGKVTPMIYRIKKYKAAKLGDFKHFKGCELQYFIPKDAFWKEVDTTKLRSKKGAIKKTKTRKKKCKEEVKKDDSN